MIRQTVLTDMTSTEKKKEKRKKMFRGTKIRQNCDSKTQNINQNSVKNISFKKIERKFRTFKYEKQYFDSC